MDLVTGGELFDAVAAEGKLSESQTRLYFQQLIDGVEYCHNRRVYHRDLKPENLLLSGDKQMLKITDFGLSSIKSQNAASELLHTIMGSPHYIAPEIITSAAEGYDGAKVDVWASGVILFGMLAGYLPFDEPDTRALYKAIVQNPVVYPPHFSYDVIKLLRAMLEKVPAKRPTMEQIKTFTWFKVNYEPVIPPSPTTQTAEEQSKSSHSISEKKKSRNRLRRTGERTSSRARKKDKSHTPDGSSTKESPISFGMLIGRGKRKKENAEQQQGEASELPFHSALFHGSSSSHDGAREEKDNVLSETIPVVSVPNSSHASASNEITASTCTQSGRFTRDGTPKRNIDATTENTSNSSEKIGNQHTRKSSASIEKNHLTKAENKSSELDIVLKGDGKGVIDSTKDPHQPYTSTDANLSPLNNHASASIDSGLATYAVSNLGSEPSSSTANLENKIDCTDNETSLPNLLAENPFVQNGRVLTDEASTSMGFSSDFIQRDNARNVVISNHPENTEQNEGQERNNVHNEVTQILPEPDTYTDTNVIPGRSQCINDVSPLSLDSKAIFAKATTEKKKSGVDASTSRAIFSTFHSPISEIHEPDSIRKSSANLQNKSIVPADGTSSDWSSPSTSGIFKPIADKLAPLASKLSGAQATSRFVPSVFNQELEEGLEGALECGIDATEAFADADTITQSIRRVDNTYERKSSHDRMSEALKKNNADVNVDHKATSIFSPLDSKFVNLSPPDTTE